MVFFYSTTISSTSPSMSTSTASTANLNNVEVDDQATYDQRQNGTENYRVNVENFVVLISSLAPQKMLSNFFNEYDLFKKRNSH